MGTIRGVGAVTEAICAVVRRSTIVFVLAVAAVLFVAPPATGQQGEGPLDTLEQFLDDAVAHDSRRGFFTWHDEDDDAVVTRTAITPTVGDTYITGDNRLYEVVAVQDDGAVTAKFVEDVKLPAGSASVPRPSLFSGFVAAAETGKQDKGPIGIYHSHNAESYVPTSDEAFTEPQGDVMQVGESLKEQLEQRGYETIWSDNSHLPHDGGAYQRSRSTVRELLEEGAVAIIDVHRDAIPADMYETEVDDESMTKIRLVVGRQNPNREANLELAKRIKSIADEEYPGLIKGIFHAQGNYNQDVGPRSILLEFGTHETSLEDALRSTELLAEVYPAAAGLAPGTGAVVGRQLGGAALRSAFWLVIIAAAGTFGYLWINEGSPQAAWARVRSFFGGAASRVGGPDDGET